MPLIDLYSGSSGLNTVLDPQRLNQGSMDAPGIIEFAQAVNVSIDDRGLVTLRQGDSLASASEFHSLFCDGGDCFVIQERTSDAVLMQVASDFSLIEVRSGLTKGRRMAWGQAAQDTFYSNGVQNGYIRAGTSYTWPIQIYQGPESDMQFATAVPSASHIAFLPGGKVLLAVGSAVFANHAPFQYGLFHPARGNVANCASDIVMLAGVQGGFYASDQHRTLFFRATEDWYQYRQELVEDAPALEGSLAYGKVNLSEINVEYPGYGRVWASTRGICIGTDGGQCVNLTEDKIVYPEGYTTGACLIRDHTVIHTAI